MSANIENIIQQLSDLLPELEHSRETHIQWRDCDQRFRDMNPDIGSAEFHDIQAKVYEERLLAIRNAIEYLVTRREAGDDRKSG